MVKSKLYLFVFSFYSKKSEVECLIRIFYSLVERADIRLANTGLDHNTFLAILHSIFGMTNDMLMNRGKKSWRLKWAKLRWQICIYLFIYIC